jgi:AraC-like DNA-binding protein
MNKRSNSQRIEKGTISICFVDNALQGVRARGLDVDDILRRVDISPSLLRLPLARVSATSYSALWRLIAQELDDEFFGQDSRRMKVGSFAILCRHLVHCKDLRQALQRALAFFDILLDDIHASLSADQGLARITLQERPASNAPRIFAHETLLIMLHGLICWLVGRRVPILSVAFAYPEPVYSAEYRIMYSTTLRFSQPDTVVAFDASCLDLPVIQNERTVVEFLRIAPENVILKYKNRNSMAAKIRKRLRAQALHMWPDFDTLAAELHLSVSTLHRRLDEEGQSYQAIKDELRRDLAIDYLCHSEKSVAEIAESLGFAEPSSFHRAFKKWTGARPAEYRKYAGAAEQ